MVGCVRPHGPRGPRILRVLEDEFGALEFVFVIAVEFPPVDVALLVVCELVAPGVRGHVLEAVEARREGEAVAQGNVRTRVGFVRRPPAQPAVRLVVEADDAELDEAHGEDAGDGLELGGDGDGAVVPLRAVAEEQPAVVSDVHDDLVRVGDLPELVAKLLPQLAVRGVRVVQTLGTAVAVHRVLAAILGLLRKPRGHVDLGGLEFGVVVPIGSCAAAVCLLVKNRPDVPHL
mmetsp:Transcript_69459/g.175087  ORF Transcript_69459/g.175087 Transcript_69459/m.175087 type:complete len:232 (+) Transcript_69459:824-1519(+)